jgi:hypothetical protein
MGTVADQDDVRRIALSLVRLAAVGEDELRELITDAWRSQAPRDLVRASGL